MARAEWKRHKILVEIPAVGVTTKFVVGRIQDLLNRSLELRAPAVGRIRVKNAARVSKTEGK